ncbi:hypothetical protein JTB14_019549 [Gonioctena quinquepunctata]|nr:hypothetical protein JTB14_019549 [Gonioctena quinquepunctata]
MPNKYERNTVRGINSVEIYELASEEFTIRGGSFRNAASSYNLIYMSLQRYIEKKKAYQANQANESPSVGYVSPTILTEEKNIYYKSYRIIKRAILDNHASHMTSKNIEFCRENGIILLTFPPHCTHELGASKLIQPVIIGCAQLLGNAGFSATGIWPVITHTFGEADFLPSQVTDRILPNPGTEQSLSVPQITENPEERTLTPNLTIGIARILTPRATTSDVFSPELLTVQNMTSLSRLSILSNNADEPVASTSSAHSPLDITSYVFSPELLRPLPEAPPRKRNQPHRRKIKSAVLTDTPTKDEIAVMKASRKMKNVKRRVSSERKKKPKKIRKTYKESEVDDEEDEAEEDAGNNCLCLCCNETFANRKSREEWVQCLECKGLSHGVRTGGEFQYVCHDYLSN